MYNCITFLHTILKILTYFSVSGIRHFYNSTPRIFISPISGTKHRRNSGQGGKSRMEAENRRRFGTAKTGTKNIKRATSAHHGGGAGGADYWKGHRYKGTV